MKIAQSILYSLCLLISTSCLAETVDVDFTYTDDHRVDFSTLKGSLQVGKFTDERADTAPTLITAVNFGSNTDGYNANRPLTDLVEDALKQGFISGGATLSEANADFVLRGSILAIDAVKTDRAGVENIQITFRTKVELTGGGRTIWQTTLFGRGFAPVEDGIVPAVHAALSRMIRELVGDDYFKMEIL